MARVLVVSSSSDEGRGLARLLRRDGHRTDVARSDTAALRGLSIRIRFRCYPQFLPLKQYF